MAEIEYRAKSAAGKVRHSFFQGAAGRSMSDDDAPKETSGQNAVGSAVWIDEWLSPVRSGLVRMSRRSLRSIEKHCGLPAVIHAAQERGLHLVQLSDDKGNEIVAASARPFKTLC